MIGVALLESRMAGSSTKMPKKPEQICKVNFKLEFFVGFDKYLVKLHTQTIILRMKSSIKLVSVM